MAGVERSVDGASGNGSAREYLDSALGEMNHAAANSLNTIAATTQFAGLLLERGETDEAVGSLRRVEGQCLRVARLLREGREFLTFVTPAVREPVDLVEMMGDCARAFAEQGRVVVQPSGDAVASVNADALRRMFVELLDNAFRFGGREVNVRFTTEASGGRIRVRIHDDGDGVDDASPRIFVPFFSSCPQECSGLGLALARRIAEAHAGTIEMEAVPRGACFCVCLPKRSHSINTGE